MRLMLTDIDGTILPWGKSEVTPRVREAFHVARAAGHVVGVASGRGYSWVPGFFGGDAACCETALATNGMQIYHEGRLVLERSLSAEGLAAMREVVHGWPGAGMLAFEGSQPLLVEGTKEILAPLFPGYATACRPSNELPTGTVIKANVFVAGGEEEQRALVAALAKAVPEFDVDLARPGFSNVMPHGWNKGTAVAYLRDYLGVAPEDVFVFGDANNDLPMFRAVRNSVAVGNATPEAADAARWHIGTVDEDAVADAIVRLAAGEFPFSE